MKTIGERIRARRKELGYTQKQVAVEIGVSAVAVTQWEGDITAPRGDNLIRLATVLNCKPDFILGGQEQPGSSSGIGIRIKEAREEQNLSQAQVSEACGWTKLGQRIDNYEQGVAEPSYSELVALGKALSVNASWLAFGGASPFSNATEGAGKVGEEIAHYHYEAKRIDLPLLTEEAITANADSLSQAEPINQVNFQRAQLEKAGIAFRNAYCTTVEGDQMTPILPDGAIVAFDTKNTTVKDGELYVVLYGPLVQVRVLERLPDGYRLKVFNDRGYSATEVTGDAVSKLLILGRVFWYSVYRP